MTLAIRLSGAGGHGVALAGLILAEAAAAAGRRVVCTQAHGPASRGGASRSDVLISDHRVAFPVPRRLDVLAALTQEAWDRSHSVLVPTGIAITDEGRVALAPRGAGAAERPHAGSPDGAESRRRETAAHYALPIIETARAITGSTLGTNMVLLGIVCDLTGAVPAEILEDVAARRVPAPSRVVNLAAFQAGRRLAAAIQETRPPAGGGA